MKSGKKRGAARREARESDSSLLFFAQGEANAAAERAAYERELGDGARRQAVRRWWILLMVAALLALAAGIAAARYVASG